MVDRKDSHDSKRWKVALLDEIPVGNTLADKFANLGEIPRMIPNSVQLKRRRLLRTNSPNTNTSYQSGLTSRFLSYEDMLGNVLEGLPQYVFQPPSKYDEDEDVILYTSWDDAWQKNDGESKEKDVIDTIVDKIVSADPQFKIDAHKLLSEYKDLFSRTLNAIPINVDPLKIEIDRVKFETKKAQGPPRLMTAEKDAHMAKFISEELRTNVIRPSNARYYSQVHLVVKPQADANTDRHNAHIDGKSMNSTPQACSISIPPPKPREWRTTIDYRHYNTCITKQYWSIPNSKNIIDRID